MPNLPPLNPLPVNPPEINPNLKQAPKAPPVSAEVAAEIQALHQAFETADKQPVKELEKDKTCIDSTQGQAKTSVDLEQTGDLTVTPNKDGSIIVGGFAPGDPPSAKEAFRTAFPHSKEIELVGSDHTRPYDTYAVKVDGKMYTGQYLYGGFLPSSQFKILPGEPEFLHTDNIKGAPDKAFQQPEINILLQSE